MAHASRRRRHPCDTLTRSGLRVAGERIVDATPIDVIALLAAMAGFHGDLDLASSIADTLDFNLADPGPSLTALTYVARAARVDVP